MGSKKVEKTVNASPEEVFAFVTDLKNATKHVPAIEKLEVLTKGKLGVGTRFVQARRILGTSLEQEMEITEFDPPENYAARGEAHGCEVTGSLSLKPAGDKTKVVARVNVEPTGFAGKLAASMILKGAEIAMHEDLEAMKTALEAR
jgi:carbon monoxide dehydrogenase subunit G